MIVINNIDCVQIQIKAGKTDYYLPQNVNWKNRIIDKIVIDTESKNAPITFAPVVDNLETPVITIYDTENKQIARNLSFENLNFTNNEPLYINSEISTNLSYIRTTEDFAINNSGSVLLLYFFYGTKNIEYTIIKRSVTININLRPAEEVSLQKVIENYIALQPANIKGVIAWTDGFYLTLREHNNRRTLNYIPATYMFPQTLNYQSSLKEHKQVHTFRLDDLNINMYNSYVTNSSIKSANTAKITFLY